MSTPMPPVRPPRAEDMCEFATVTKKCYFCDQPRIILTNEHWIFCPNCMALYTFMLVQESNCEHIKDGVPTVQHYPPKHRSDDKAHVYYVYWDHGDVLIMHRCSVCNRGCKVDGW